MRFSLIDLLIAIGIIGICSAWIPFLAPDLPESLQPIAGLFVGICLYAILICPIYRRFKLFPMLLPRCPCCSKSQMRFQVLHADWPRVAFRCPTCNGEFVIWHNGTPGGRETWDKPVLALKWPYAFGRYKRMEQPEQSPTGNVLKAAPEE